MEILLLIHEKVYCHIINNFKMHFLWIKFIYNYPNLLYPHISLGYK